MEDSYISNRDKIVASAIELIGDLGLHALTPKNLVRKQNISDTLIYKYFGGIDEVLIAVVNEYAAFDINIQRTVDHLDGSYIDKIRYYADTYATYYDNYIGMGAIMLHYEELLHMSETREIISECMLKRNDFVCSLFQGAIENKEIRPVFTPKELTLVFNGLFTEGLLERRNQYSRKSFRVEMKEMIGHLEKILRL
ncbi:TetR/AcrR family transcriptional regulator [Coprococcus eutactus]|uniref:TetR/AcrR family transcriptional regulator n=1 Tax=Coprococcus eutactus TaxID=33043 RepID=UPI001D05FD90|nr:TetR/AcrR family transcriptional regulator [Coprococcus eutactus]MCB6628339.1 TetR/AcrR family transcriptional regulator [Coprococcus eutactus]MCG4791148.1 TetR/AcrR family transcriptional regulator [Coprococcus eutactus]MCQ5119960.1 TetR/AcrR family transcriptional regulator [Coprococcus eutactus]MCQ5133835.1 TetR/AcrR family transcriptional regulator [Coprococcus eutactus]MCQ5136902.1 TetR/AcrR family transcriptional regulator [Coprococcus eutactus]